jgi:hypothetical protein
LKEFRMMQGIRELILKNTILETGIGKMVAAVE